MSSFGKGGGPRSGGGFIKIIYWPIPRIYFLELLQNLDFKILTFFMGLFPPQSPGHIFWHCPKKYGKKSSRTRHY